MRFFSRRYSLMIRIIVLLLAAMLPLVVIYYTAHSINRRMLRGEVTSSLLRQNQDFADRLRDDMVRIINTNYMLTRNWELGKLGVVPDEFSPYEKAQTLQNIQDKIYLAQINSRFIQDIHVYFPALDKCLSTNSSASTLNEMRALTADIDNLPKDQFFFHNDEMRIVSETTFSKTADEPSLVIQTTLSRRELLLFFQDVYWNDVSQGAVFGLHNAAWPGMAAESPPEEALYAQVTEALLREGGQEQPDGQGEFRQGGRTYQFVYSYIAFADIVLVRYFDIARVVSGFGLDQGMLWLFAAVAALAFLWIYYTLYRLVNRPLKHLMRAFSHVEEGDLHVAIQSDAKSEFAFVFKGFDNMLSRLRVLMDQTYRQGQMVKRAELKQLQAQIDPHFLYNGFFILNKRIRAQDNEGALAFSQLLSDYFRYVTQNAQDIVPLREEVAHAYNYARIQQVRFANRLSLSLMQIPKEYEEILIPRLVLQPIVENVFRHVLDTAEGVTMLGISYRQVQGQLEIWIEDSGTQMTGERLQAMRGGLFQGMEGGEVSGLTNVHLRLRLYFGESYGLNYEKSEMGGLRVRVRIQNGKEQHP